MARRKTSRSLRHSVSHEERHNAQLGAVVAASIDGIVGLGAGLVVQTWNAGAQRMFGYSETEARGHRLSELIVPDVYKDEADGICAALLNGGTVLRKVLRRHKDGRLIPVEVIASPTCDPWGNVIGASVIYRDISTCRRAGRGWHTESETRFREAFEKTPVGIAHLSPDLRYLRVNEAFCRIHGYTANELTTKSLLDTVPPDDFADLAARSEPMRDGKIDHFETERQAQRKDGTIFWVRVSVGCVRKSDESIDYFVVVDEDISDRKRAEKELADSEARFRATFENAGVGISHVAPDGKFLRFNRTLPQQLGWTADELLTKSFWEIAHPDDLAFELAQFKKLEDGRIDSYSVERRDLRKDGTAVWIRLTRSCVRKGDGSADYFVGVFEDISARKRAEEEFRLLMREARHRTKNILGLVQVIARQIAGSEARDFSDRFTERIQALAANQDLLVRHEWQRIDVKDLVQVQLGHFADLIGTRINFDGPKLHLNAAAAQAIGLALHELATNAGKYGALSTDAGCVDVSWRIDDGIFVTNWIERNGPPVRSPEHRGFGTMVTVSMVKQALGGDVQLDYAPWGLEWHLTCPAANALERPDAGLGGRVTAA